MQHRLRRQRAAQNQNQNQAPTLSGQDWMYDPIQYEISRFRGLDQDIADVEVKGWANRNLVFCDSLDSPANVKALLNNNDSVNQGQEVTEDDVLFAENLPLFQQTLSVEESELLCSYLTVPYARIPLIVEFFGTKDRVTYLFNRELQQVLRAVVFEGSSWTFCDGGLWLC